MTSDEIEKIKLFIKNQEDILLAYIYGSQAEGNARKNSDVDIAVVVDPKKTPSTPYGRDINLAAKLEKILKKETDVRMLNQASPFFAFQVVSKGKVLYSADENQRAEFESKSRCKYFDLKPLYDTLYKEMNERIEKGEYGVRL